MQTIPDRWAPLLREHIQKTIGEDREHLSATDFEHHVRLSFPDGSSAFFLYAFYISAPSLNEIAVFTEHCGYHYFPYHDTQVELLRSVGDCSS